MPKNKLILIVVAVVAIAVIGAVAVFAARSKSSGSSGDSSNASETIRTIQPEDIGLQLSLTPDQKEVVMTITKLDGVKSIEYETSYDAEEKDPESGETAILTQGATSGDPVEVKGMDKLERKITLGTCSKNVCRYHKVVSDIHFVIKVNYLDGSVGQAEDSLAYPHDSSDSSGDE